MAVVLYAFTHEKVKTPERRSVMKRLFMLRDGGRKMPRLARPFLGVLVLQRHSVPPVPVEERC